MKPLALLVAACLAATAPLAPAQPAARGGEVQTKLTSLPARGLFEGDRLSAYAQQRLTELVINAIGLQVEVALIVPTGPWNLEGSGRDERDLTPARLEAVKRFLKERGVDPKKTYVESRIDDKLKEPRLDVQILGRSPAD